MLPGLGATAALAVAERQGAALQARFAARRDNLAEATRLRQVAPGITDAEALLKDRRALTLVLEAFQLETEIDKRATLRRVLTEDPANSKSLVNRLTDPRWRELAKAFAPPAPVALSLNDIAAQGTTQLRAMSAEVVGRLDLLQVQALSAEQVAALDPSQVAAINPDAVVGLDLRDVRALSAAQVAALGPAQIRALDPTQVAAIEPRDMVALGEAQLRALDAKQIAALTPAQITALNPGQVAAFTADQAASFSATQLDAFGGGGRALLATAPRLPDASQPAASRPAGRTPQVHELSAAQVAGLSAAQIGALDPAQIRALQPAQVMAIDAEDIPALGEAQLRALDAVQLAALRPAQIAAFRPAQVAAFTAGQAAAFSPAQLDAFGAGGRALLAAAPHLPEGPPAAARRPLADAGLVEKVIERAMVNRYEKAMGDANPGLREALYFRRMAGSITSINGLMADRALLEVVRGGLGLPKSVAALEFEQQRDILTRRVNIAQFQDPSAVAKMAQRYLTTVDGGGGSGSPVLALFGGAGGAEGIAALAGKRISLSA
jgi:hypothetical protein